MYKIFAPFLLLPVIELVGFFTIGAEIGFLGTIVWLALAAWLGFYLMRLRGRSGLERMQRAAHDDMFVVQDLFDGVALFIASVLLIFPGFISDFIAVPILIAPLRRYVFLHLNKKGVVHTGAGRPQEGAAAPRETPDVIEGSYRKIED